MTCPLLRIPWRTQLVEEERNKMYRFVGVIIIFIPQQVGRSLIKQISQIRYHFFFASHQFDHARHIVRHEPSLLVSIGLNATIPFLCQCILRPRFPGTIRISWAEPSFLLVKYIAISLSFFIKTSGFIFFSQCFSQLRNTPVCISIFQSV